MELFKLLGTVAINGAEEAKNDVEGVTSKAGKLGSALKTGVTTVAKWGAAIGTAAVGATTAFVKFAESSATTADNIDKMSQKIGISRQAYQELDFICSQSGTSVDSLQAGMKTLTAAMDGAASGTKANVEQFEALGISVTDANGNLRSQEEVMWEAMSALQGMENQTEKARLATQLFGRSGTELMPLLNGASGSIEEMKNKAHELGLVMDDSAIDSGVTLTDTLDQIKRATGAVFTKLGSALVPILQKVCNLIVSNMPRIQNLIGKLEPILTSMFDKLLPPIMELNEKIFPVLLDLIISLLPVLSDLFSQVLPILVDILQAILPTLVKVVQDILPIFVEILNLLLPPLAEIVQMLMPVLQELLLALVPILEPLLELVKPLLDLLMAILKPLLRLIQKILPPLIEILQAVAMTISDVLVPIINVLTEVFDALPASLKDVGKWFANIWDGIVSVWNKAGEFFGKIVDGIKKPFVTIADWFKGIFTKAWEGVKAVFSTGGKIFDGIKDGIVSAFKTVVNAIIKGINKVVSVPFNAINSILRDIRDISIMGIEPFDFIETFSVPQIPLLAKGTVVNKATPAIIGEDGAEAVVPLENNTKWLDEIGNRLNSYGGNNTEVVSKLDELIESIKMLKIYLYNDVLVGELTPALDASLGTVYSGKVRGR